MKKIHTTGFDIYSLGDHIIFQDYRNDSSLYYMYSSMNGIKNISRATFLTQKFGPQFSLILPYLEDENENVVAMENGNIITCGFRNFYFQWFSGDGEFLKKREDIGFNSIYGFDIDQHGNIWYVIPTHDYVGVFSVEKNIELFPLGNYKFSGCFSMPESIVIYDDYAYISDMGNKRIIRINTLTFEIKEYLNFDEPVWEYIRCSNLEIVRLESGIYQIQ